ncbi:hypothetical protein FDECE_7689 [Fusarium decemcellulare]|nr:hypothetical protein FDECE_7689 [Fusarium decemcellulare]
MPKARDSHPFPNSSNDGGFQLDPQALLDNMKYEERLFKYTVNSKNHEPRFLVFRSLQALNLNHLQNELAKLKNDVWENGVAQDTTRMAQLLHDYTNAIRDYEYLKGLVPITGSQARNDRLDLELYFKEVGNFADGGASYRRFADPTMLRSDHLRNLLKRVLHRSVTWNKKEIERRDEEYLNREAPFEVSPFVDILARFLVALLGGALLVVPMLIMSLPEVNRTRSLCTVSVSVLLFSGFLSMFFKASNTETLIATATLRQYQEQGDFVARVASSLTPDFEPLYFRGRTKIPVVIPDELGFSQMALEEANVPGLFKLPSEILIRIQAFSQEEPIWDCVRACALKLELATLPTTPSTNPMSIADVDSWVWGQDKPKRIADSDDTQLIRITLDSRGIKRIERLARRPLPLFENTLKSERFIVDSAASLKQVTIQFKDGLAWMKRPSEEFRLQLWDTPTPPAIIDNDLNNISRHSLTQILQGHPSTLDSCAMLWSRARDSTHFHTVDLKTCTGIMFSYHAHTGTLHAIHDPRSPSPSTVDNHDYLSQIYVPVPPGDEIVSILAFCDPMTESEGMPLSFVIETKLAGDIHVGPKQPMPALQAVRVEWPSTLIFGEPPLPYDSEYPVLALYPNVTADLPLRFRRPEISPQRKRLRKLWSWAPLDNVTQVRVFYLDMECGLQGRTIGQCYADDDWCRTWEKPSRLFYNRSSERKCLVFEKRPEASDPRIWKENKMAGEIHYWINSDFISTSDDIEVLPEGSWLTM